MFFFQEKKVYKFKVNEGWGEVEMQILPKKGSLFAYGNLPNNIAYKRCDFLSC